MHPDEVGRAARMSDPTTRPQWIAMVLETFRVKPVRRLLNFKMHRKSRTVLRFKHGEDIGLSSARTSFALTPHVEMEAPPFGCLVFSINNHLLVEEASFLSSGKLRL
jgi:hypothetical protein